MSDAPAAPPYAVLATVPAANPLRTAQLFGAVLAADKGYSSRIVRVDRNTVDCVASDDRAVRFART